MGCYGWFLRLGPGGEEFSVFLPGCDGCLARHEIWPSGCADLRRKQPLVIVRTQDGSRDVYQGCKDKDAALREFAGVHAPSPGGDLFSSGTTLNDLPASRCRIGRDPTDAPPLARAAAFLMWLRPAVDKARCGRFLDHLMDSRTDHDHQTFRLCDAVPVGSGRESMSSCCLGGGAMHLDDSVAAPRPRLCLLLHEQAAASLRKPIAGHRDLAWPGHHWARRATNASPGLAGAWLESTPLPLPFRPRSSGTT